MYRLVWFVTLFLIKEISSKVFLKKLILVAAVFLKWISTVFLINSRLIASLSFFNVYSYDSLEKCSVNGKNKVGILILV